MTKRWDKPAYIKSLPDMPLKELCERLRGEYPSAIEPYEAHPMSKEAARRLEMLRDAITEVEWLRERDQEEAARRLEAMQAEIERLRTPWRTALDSYRAENERLRTEIERLRFDHIYEQTLTETLTENVSWRRASRREIEERLKGR